MTHAKPSAVTYKNSKCADPVMKFYFLFPEGRTSITGADEIIWAQKARSSKKVTAQCVLYIT
jgi:hypothetical protein